MDTGLESRIEDLHPIGCQEQYTLVVFKYAKKYGDKLVSFKLVQRSLFQEDVGLMLLAFRDLDCTVVFADDPPCYVLEGSSGRGRRIKRFGGRIEGGEGV